MRKPESNEQTRYTDIAETVRSNTLDLEIKLSSPDWHAVQLTGIVEILSGHSSPEEMQRAAHRLRFLNSAASTVELAKLFSGVERNDPASTEFFFGLYGSPNRQLAIDSLHKEIEAPEHAISQSFLNTLVDLQIDSDPAWTPPASSNSPEAVRTFDAYERRRKAHELELLKVECRKLLAALPLKIRQARALSALGVLVTESDDPDFIQAARPILIAAWDDLPLASQQGLVDSQWSLVDVQEMVPILVRMASGPVPTAHMYAATIRDTILKRLRELDPAVARPLILSELQKSKGEPTVELLELLEPQDVALAIQPVIDRIDEGRPKDDDFARLDQFGGLGALAPIKNAFEKNLGTMDCRQMASTLRYFLRVAPEYGATQVAASLKTKGRVDAYGTKLDCRGSILFSLDDQFSPAEQVAIRTLDDPNPEIVQDAAQSLGRWGSSAAEAPLWARMERFHAQWAHRSPKDFDATVEQNLVSALAGGTNWLCTPEKLARLKGLAVTDYERTQIETWMDEWKDGPPLVTPNWWGEDAVEFGLLASSGLTVDQIRAKLAQFPQGTQVSWQIWQPGYIASSITMKRQEAEFEAMRAFSAQKGVMLVKSITP
jgi:hypothetical protein